MSSVRNLGSYVRELRINANLKQSELAAMVGISEETLSAIERNKRPLTQSVLGSLLNALGLEPTRARALTSMYANTQLPDYEEATAHEMSALEAISAPAFYQDMRTYRTLAANAAARLHLPGLTPGKSVVEWLLLDPSPRQMIAEWEMLAHTFVYSLRVMAAGLLDPVAFESIVRACSQAPEWETMWNNQIEEVAPVPVVTHIDPATGKRRQYHITSLTLQYPRSGWWLWMVSPAAS